MKMKTINNNSAKRWKKQITIVIFQKTQKLQKKKIIKIAINYCKIMKIKQTLSYFNKTKNNNKNKQNKNCFK